MPWARNALPIRLPSCARPGKEIVEQESQAAVLEAADSRAEAGKIDRDEEAEQQHRCQLCRQPEEQLHQVFGPLADRAGKRVEVRFGVMPHEHRGGVAWPTTSRPIRAV